LIPGAFSLVVTAGLYFPADVLLFFLFRQSISKLCQSIAAKFCNIIGRGLNFITQVQKFGAFPSKIIGLKHAKFGVILDNFRL